MVKNSLFDRLVELTHDEASAVSAGDGTIPDLVYSAVEGI